MNFLTAARRQSVMRKLQGAEATWAEQEFGGVNLGDSRRSARLVLMGARAAKAPSGKVSQVFRNDGERQGAYDFLEGGHVVAETLIASLGLAALRRGVGDEFVFTAIDGSSLALVDHAGSKNFGSVGSSTKGGRGLKMINALGVSPDGVPLGLVAQVWWARAKTKSRSRKDKRRNNLKRKAEEKETRFWLQAIEESHARADQLGIKLWFQLDREADNRCILLHLAKAVEQGHRFTVRGSWDRLIQATGNDKLYLRAWLDREAPGGQYLLGVPAGPKRTARTANIVVRWATVTLRLRDRWSKTEKPLTVTAVWAREEGTVPAGEAPIDWLLLTSVQVDSFEQARRVIFGYTQRWRVEDFHKAWKSGVCNVEQTQLRTQRAVLLWGTILAAVAVRVERLKRLARTAPDQPADLEMTHLELRALILLKRQSKKRNETIPDTVPTIAQAVRWIADLGGYTGKSSGGPPGSITIRRGLEWLAPAVLMLEALENQQTS